jgi:hypothetical protein
MTAIQNAAHPLNDYERSAFLAAVHVYFRGRTEVGDSELGRALRELQYEHRKSSLGIIRAIYSSKFFYQYHVVLVVPFWLPRGSHCPLTSAT